VVLYASVRLKGSVAGTVGSALLSKLGTNFSFANHPVLVRVCTLSNSPNLDGASEGIMCKGWLIAMSLF
jgi:hypothetical protein